MRLNKAALFGAVLALAPQVASAGFSVPNGARVYPVNANVFEVVPRGNAAASTYWCAASNYARRALGAGWNDLIYIARGRGPSVATKRTNAVQFTLNPTAAGITPTRPAISINSLPVGDNMSVQQGQNYCTLPTGRF